MTDRELCECAAVTAYRHGWLGDDLSQNHEEASCVAPETSTQSTAPNGMRVWRPGRGSYDDKYRGVMKAFCAVLDVASEAMNSADTHRDLRDTWVSERHDRLANRLQLVAAGLLSVLGHRTCVDRLYELIWRASTANVPRSSRAEPTSTIVSKSLDLATRIGGGQGAAKLFEEQQALQELIMLVWRGRGDVRPLRVCGWRVPNWLGGEHVSYSADLQKVRNRHSK
jgi:hypothetical protein